MLAQNPTDADTKEDQLEAPSALRARHRRNGSARTGAQRAPRRRAAWSARGAASPQSR